MPVHVTRKRYVGWIQPLNNIGRKAITIVESDNERYALSRMQEGINDALAYDPRFVGHIILRDTEDRNLTPLYNAVFFMQGGGIIIHQIESLADK